MPSPLGSLLLETSGSVIGASTGPDLTRYVLICGLLVLAVVGLGLGLRRTLAGAMKKRASRRSLEVLDVLPLGGKQRLVVVRCYDRSFLIGSGEKQLTTLAELDLEPLGQDDPLPPLAEAARARVERPAPGRPLPSFAELLTDEEPVAEPVPRPRRSALPRLRKGGILG